MGAKEKQDKQRRGQEEGEVCLVSVLGSASVCTTTQTKRSRHTLTVLIRERARGAERGDSEVSETQRERKRQVILLIGSKHMVEPKMCISQQSNSQIIISIQQPMHKIDFTAIIELRKLTGHKYLLPVINGTHIRTELFRYRSFGSVHMYLLRFWDGSDSEKCWYKPNTSIDSSGRDQLLFPCLRRDAPHTCAERSASERDHSFLWTTSFNSNKHDWTSHASCNRSISVSTPCCTKIIPNHDVKTEVRTNHHICVPLHPYQLWTYIYNLTSIYLVSLNEYLYSAR